MSFDRRSIVLKMSQAPIREVLAGVLGGQRICGETQWMEDHLISARDYALSRLKNGDDILCKLLS